VKIGIDMDGVMIDTINFTSKELTTYLGYKITPDDIAHRLGEINDVDKIFEEKGLHLLCSLSPLENVTEVINELSQEHEFYIISARFNIHYNATIEWLEKYGIKVKEIIFTEGRGKADICVKYGIDLFIEDSVKNALEVSKTGVKVILLSTGYNKSVESNEIDYCENWNEIGRYIKLFSSEISA
jgi:uncharacterized HAD superfamily protein